MSQDSFNEDASTFSWNGSDLSGLSERLDSLGGEFDEAAKAVEQLVINIEFLRIMLLEDLI